MSQRESVGSGPDRMPFQQYENTTAKSESDRDGAGNAQLLEDDSFLKEKAKHGFDRVTCLLGVRNRDAYNGSFAQEDALINKSIFPPGTVKAGDRIQITALSTDSPIKIYLHHGIKQYNSALRRRSSSGMRGLSIDSHVRVVTVIIARSKNVAQGAYYVFSVKETSAELSMNYPNLQVRRLFRKTMEFVG